MDFVINIRQASYIGCCEDFMFGVFLSLGSLRFTVPKEVLTTNTIRSSVVKYF